MKYSRWQDIILKLTSISSAFNPFTLDCVRDRVQVLSCLGCRVTGGGRQWAYAQLELVPLGYISSIYTILRIIELKLFPVPVRFHFGSG